MRIGLSYDLKQAVTAELGSPDDALEEYDCTETIDIIARTLKEAGHTVVRLSGGDAFLRNVLQEQVDFVFNISEGRGNYRSREAQVPCVLEMLDIPYSGSDPQCLAVCLDKPRTKTLVAAAGIPTPAWRVVNDEEEMTRTDWASLPYPVIVKPACEGASKGIRLTSLANGPGQAVELVRELVERYRQPALVEEFIIGDEVTVGVIGNRPAEVIGIMRVRPRREEPLFVYSVEVKRDWQRLVDYECPANLPTPVQEKVKDLSLRAFQTLTCRDFARIDFRIRSDGTPFFLEMNPLPGLGSYSDLVIMAIKLGWTHEGLVNAVLDKALKRHLQCVPG